MRVAELKLVRNFGETTPLLAVEDALQREIRGEKSSCLSWRSPEAKSRTPQWLCWGTPTRVHRKIAHVPDT